MSAAETVEVEFDTCCAASLCETWLATVPAGLSADELRERLRQELQAGRCEWISEEAFGDHRRAITEIRGASEPEPATHPQTAA